MADIKGTYLQLHNPLKMRHNKVHEIQYFLMSKSRKAEQGTSQIYLISQLCRQDFACFVRVKQWCFSLLINYCNQCTCLIVSASISLVFLVNYGIFKMFLKTVRRKKIINSHQDSFVSQKQIEQHTQQIFKALIYSVISHDVFTLLIDKE